MKSPEEIIGVDAVLALQFAGYEVVAIGYAVSELDIGQADFDAFWAAYPRKTAKPAALKAYRAARKRKATHLQIMTGLDQFVASRPDPQFTPHASTWLNQDRWNDRPMQKQLSTTDARRAELKGRIENGYGAGRQGNPDSPADRRLAFRQGDR